MKNKEIVLVKETGEILEIETHYKIMTVSFNMPIELAEFAKDKIKDYEMEFIDDKIEPTKEGSYYTLSNGQKYSGNELVVGLENIRDYKLNNIIK